MRGKFLPPEQFTRNYRTVQGADRQSWIGESGGAEGLLLHGALRRRGVCVKFGDQVYGVTVDNVGEFFEQQVVGRLK